jgi:hypothetical protein
MNLGTNSSHVTISLTKAERKIIRTNYAQQWETIAQAVTRLVKSYIREKAFNEGWTEEKEPSQNTEPKEKPSQKEKAEKTKNKKNKHKPKKRTI